MQPVCVCGSGVSSASITKQRLLNSISVLICFLLLHETFLYVRTYVRTYVSFCGQLTHLKPYRLTSAHTQTQRERVIRMKIIPKKRSFEYRDRVILAFIYYYITVIICVTLLTQYVTTHIKWFLTFFYSSLLMEPFFYSFSYTFFPASFLIRRSGFGLFIWLLQKSCIRWMICLRDIQPWWMSKSNIRTIF